MSRSFKIERMLASVPKDGCLLVFDANHQMWRNIIAIKVMTHLRCTVMKDARLEDKSQSRALVRDLKIKWR